MRQAVVKIGLRGDVYLDSRAVTSEELAAAIRELNADDGVVTYDRESPETDGSAAAAEAVGHLLEHRPTRIRIGDQAPSEWGVIRSDRIMEAPPHHPELCFSEAGQCDPSLHIRIGYGPRRWASRYLLPDVPGQVASFHADVVRIARRMTSGTGRELSAEEAKRFFKP